MNTPEFEAFTNHWAGCAKCHPMHNVYCVGGRNLWIDNQAAFIANLEALKERQYWLGVIAKNSPKCIEQIKKRVLEKFEGKKSDVNVR